MAAGRVVRRVATGAVLTTVFVGVTSGVAAADTGQSAQTQWTRVSTPAPVASPTAFSVLDPGKATTFSQSMKATAWSVVPPATSSESHAATGARIAIVWAVAAAVAMAGIMAGSVLRRS